MVTAVNPRTILVFLLVSGLAAQSGCSTGTEGSSFRHSEAITRASANHWVEHRSSLLQKGKFTEAAVLTGLHDSTNWDLPDEEVQITEQQHLPPNEQLNPEKKERASEEALTIPSNGVDANYVQKTTLDGKWHARLGWSLMVSGNHKAAAAAYREALRQNDTLVDAYLGLGILLKRQGNVETAVKAFRKALTIKPQYAAALVHLGYAYADGQNNPKNIEQAKRLFYRASKQGDPFAMIALIDLKTRQ